MTRFEEFAVSSGAPEIEAALLAGFERSGLDVASCELTGAQDSSVIQVTVHPTAGAPFRFKVDLEDLLDDNGLSAKIDAAIRSR